MNYATYLIAAIIALGMAAIAGHESEAAMADRQDVEALASRDWAASQVCKGQPFEWLDDKTLACYREVRP